MQTFWKFPYIALDARSVALGQWHMSTEQLTPEQIKMRDKVVQGTPEEHQRVFAVAAKLAPKNNVHAAKDKSEATSEPLSRERLEASVTRLITEMLLRTGGKMPSEEAVIVAAKMLANKAMRESKEAVPDDEIDD
jgi:hypothetical protein